MNGLVVLVLLVLLAGGYAVSVYNRFVVTRTRLGAAIQEIGNQLKRQHDLIPNLVGSVRGYFKHEKGIFDKLTEARKAVAAVVDSGDARKLLEASGKLTAALTPIRAVFESNPQLQAAGPVSKLMAELSDTADKIMYSRRLLIDLSADFNALVATFPSNLVARLFGFKAQPGLVIDDQRELVEVEKEETITPEVKLDA
jgi:LemA protein